MAGGTSSPAGHFHLSEIFLDFLKNVCLNVYAKYGRTLQIAPPRGTEMSKSRTGTIIMMIAFIMATFITGTAGASPKLTQLTVTGHEYVTTTTNGWATKADHFTFIDKRGRNKHVTGGDASVGPSFDQNGTMHPVMGSADVYPGCDKYWNYIPLLYKSYVIWIQVGSRTYKITLKYDTHDMWRKANFAVKGVGKKGAAVKVVALYGVS